MNKYKSDNFNMFYIFNVVPLSAGSGQYIKCLLISAYILEADTHLHTNAALIKLRSVTPDPMSASY